MPPQKPLLLAVLATFLAGGAVRALAGDDGGKTVLDHFLSMPSQELYSMLPDSAEERRSAIKARDVPNGWLKATMNEGLHDVQLKLFKLRDGSDLLGVAFRGCCCEGTCDRRLQFLAVRNGGFVDVTHEVWTPPSPAELRRATRAVLGRVPSFEIDHAMDEATYELSRRRATLTIEVNGRPALRYRFVADRFVRF